MKKPLYLTGAVLVTVAVLCGIIACLVSIVPNDNPLYQTAMVVALALYIILFTSTLGALITIWAVHVVKSYKPVEKESISTVQQGE